MCLVLKLDNGKVVSIANGQSDRVTEPSSTELVYRYKRRLKKSYNGNCLGDEVLNWME